MNGGSIWWEQLGTSRRFVEQIQKHMEAAESVVLHIPATLPWKSALYSIIDLRKASFSGDRQLQRLEWQPGEDPGSFILDHLCTRVVRADYFPSQTYAEYLGSRDDILLCDYYVWITGVDSREDLQRWAEFISVYNHCSSDFAKRAIFIIEYSGPKAPSGQICQLSFPMEQLDRQVFCLEFASATQNSPLRDLQAEMALRVGGEDPELSALLIDAGVNFLKDPVAVTQIILQNTRRSDHSRFHQLTKEEISSAVWKASIVLLFPVLEQWRFNLISRYSEDLRAHLPITNSNGDKITEPFDIEIGPLQFMAAQNQLFPKAEYEQLKLCRSVRNKLAHNQMVPYDEVCSVLSFT